MHATHRMCCAKRVANIHNGVYPVLEILSTSACMSRATSANTAFAAAFFARNTRATGVGVESSRMRSRAASRQRRLRRFLRAAFPTTFFETTHANEEVRSRESGETERENSVPCKRLVTPPAGKSARLKRVSLDIAYTESRVRPLRRRRVSILCPRFVRDLRKKPCVRARLRFFG